ncbi:MAG: hypothetical protein JWP10_885 [Nocardioidaceae bacterium]|nr:hypothetical protein [Nocardioidaceae bacterium]
MTTAASTVQWRFRLAACCLILTAIAFIQAPGRIVADTKFDLVINPGAFLARAFSFWDPLSAFGTVQNQAYGYLFPMGPFFWVWNRIGIEPWVIQRLWWALVFCIAFLGMVKLAGLLGVRHPLARIAAGFVFALSPRMLTVIGPSSIEVLPSALAPWVLIPLVIGVRRGNPRRLAALSALAVALVGGVNAAATFAVIPLGVLWLLCAPPGPRRRSLMVWWPGFVVLGTLWWLVPLFLLSGYSPPFLDYIESASVTTNAATVVDALRGTSSWVPYASTNLVAGRHLLTDPLLILNTGLVVVLGFVGLSRRRVPHRAFLVSSLLVGLVAVTAGHTGAGQGWFASDVQSVLDGLLAPLRNTHKFDVVLRIPLVIGFGLAVSRLVDRRSNDAMRSLGFGVFVSAIVLGATVPAWTAQLANRGTLTDVPSYWTQATSWLNAHADGTSMLAPASAFPDYVWGSSGDEPIQPLSTVPWGVRSSIPLANSGTIRFLDSVDTELGTGQTSAGLASTLRRAGVEYLVVRNDLRAEVAVGKTAALYETLSDAPNIVHMASFGPELGGSPNIDLDTERVFANGGWQSSHPAVDIFRVISPSGPTVQTMRGTPTVVGAADSLAALDSLGITTNRSVLLANDQPASITPTDLVVTDGLRHQEMAFGSVADNRSASLSPGETFVQRRPVHDYLDPGQARWMAVPKLIGADSLTASSARSQVNTPGGVRPAEQPWSAFDASTRTVWRAQQNSGALTLDLGRVTDLGRVAINAGLQPGEREDAIVQTESGPVTVRLSGSTPQQVEVGRVRTLSIKGSTVDAQFFSIADVNAAGLDVARPLVLPKTPQAWGDPATIVLGLDQGISPQCLTVNDIDRCRFDAGGWGEDGATFDRIVPLGSERRYELSMNVAPMAGSAVDALLQGQQDVTLRASSTVNSDVRSSVTRASDLDSRTGWIARPDDQDPTLTMTWDAPHKLSRLQIQTVGSLPASKVTDAVLEFDGGVQRRVKLDGGIAEFDPVTSRQVALHLVTTSPSRDFRSDGFIQNLPVGVSEISFAGAPRGDRIAADSPLVLPCGAGPSVSVGSQRYETSVATTTSDLANGRAAKAKLCDATAVPLAAGNNRIHVEASQIFKPLDLTLSSSPIATAPSVTTAVVKDASKASQTLVVGPRDAQSLVVMDHNKNPGWVARVSKGELRSVQVNGWQQGWVLPAGSTRQVALEFAPNGAYRLGILLGGLTLLVLMGLALLLGKEAPVWETAKTKGRLPRRWVFGLAAAVSFAALGGAWFILAGIAGALAVQVLRRHAVWQTVVVALGVGLAVASYVVLPWGGSREWAGVFVAPQLFAAFAVGGLVSLTRGERHDLSRKNGVSTKR